MRFFLRYIFKYNMFGYISVLSIIASFLFLFISSSPLIVYIIISPIFLFGIYFFIRTILSYKKKKRFYNVVIYSLKRNKNIPQSWYSDPCYSMIINDAKKDYNIK